MSRSKRKSPYFPHTCKKSEKKDKAWANRKLRLYSKKALKDESEVFVDKKEVSDIYSFAKDGKKRYSSEEAKRHPRIFRK